MASALVEIHSRLSLAAPRRLAKRLAFGNGFLLQVRADDARIVNSTDGSVIATSPLPHARAAVRLPYGSVLACTSDASYRFDAGQTVPHRLGRISLLPDSLLEPSRESQEHLWVVDPTLAQVQRYLLSKEALDLEATRALSDHDGRAFATLRDGAFLYTTARGLVRALGARTTSYALPKEVTTVWRLLPAERLDRAWVVSDSGEAFVLEFAGKAKVVSHFRSEGSPFDVDLAGDTLAFVSLYERGTEPRTFVLNLYSTAGTRRKSYQLDSVVVSEAPEWAARASRDHEVAVTKERNHTRVAVGGVSSLRLFGLENEDEIVVR